MDKRIQIGLGIVVSGGLIGLVLSLADPGNIAQTLSRADPAFLGLAALTYCLVIAVRWLRLIGIAESDSLSPLRVELLWTVATHSFANQIMPARTGEVTFPLLWEKSTGRGLVDGGMLLIILRVLELGVLLPLYSIALVLWLYTDAGSYVYIVVGLGILGGSSLLIFLSPILKKAISTLRALTELQLLRQFDIPTHIRNKLEDASEAIDKLKPTDRLWICSTTLVMWLLLFATFYCSIIACGETIGIVQSVVGSGGGILGSILPLGAIGSIGTMEAGWTAAFTATGAEIAPIATAGFVVHLLVIFANGLVAAISFGIINVSETSHTTAD